MKATGEISHIPSIHMFITKLNSKQKQLKMVQEYNIGSLTQQKSRGKDIYSRWRALNKNNSRGEEGYSLEASKIG